MMKKRTVTYSAEEKALMVMLEGVQEEERRRDIEKKLKEERERQLQRKHKVDTMLFGGNCIHPVYRTLATVFESF